MPGSSEAVLQLAFRGIATQAEEPTFGDGALEIRGLFGRAQAFPESACPSVAHATHPKASAAGQGFTGAAAGRWALARNCSPAKRS